MEWMLFGIVARPSSITHSRSQQRKDKILSVHFFCVRYFQCFLVADVFIDFLFHVCEVRTQSSKAIYIYILKWYGVQEVRKSFWNMMCNYEITDRSMILTHGYFAFEEYIHNIHNIYIL